MTGKFATCRNEPQEKTGVTRKKQPTMKRLDYALAVDYAREYARFMNFNTRFERVVIVISLGAGAFGIACASFVIIATWASDWHKLAAIILSGFAATSVYLLAFHRGLLLEFVWERRKWQYVALFYARSAGKELLDKRRIRASFYIERVLEVLPRFLGKQRIEAHPWRTCPTYKDAISFTIRALDSKAISAAIQGCGDRADEFCHRLDNIAQILSREMKDEDYSELQESLLWLVGQSKGLRTEKRGLVERLPFATEAVRFAVVIAPLIAPAVVALSSGR